MLLAYSFYSIWCCGLILCILIWLLQCCYCVLVVFIVDGWWVGYCLIFVWCFLGLVVVALSDLVLWFAVCFLCLFGNFCCLHGICFVCEFVFGV